MREMSEKKSDTHPKTLQKRIPKKNKNSKNKGQTGDRNEVIDIHIRKQ